MQTSTCSPRSVLAGTVSIRTLCAIVWAVALLAWTPAEAAHEAGETVSLIGASQDGRMVAVLVKDVQGRYCDIRLLDVDGHDSASKRFLEGSEKERKAYVRKLRKTHRIGRPPSPSIRHPTLPLEGRIYTWRAERDGLMSAFSLVGPVGQIVARPVRVSCFKASPSDCPANQSEWSKSRQVEVHWFHGGVYLVVVNWTVKDDAGDEARAMVVHQRLPPRPVRPPIPPMHNNNHTPAGMAP